MALTDRQKTAIEGALKARVKGPCPMCGKTEWSLQEEFVMATTTSIGGGIAIGGQFVPMVQLICMGCGFVSHHAVGLLGISLNE